MARPSPIKPITLVLCTVPALWAVFCALTDRLGANPIERLINRAGFWTLTFLTLSLVPTTVKLVTGHKQLLKVRRMLGLTAFVYACIHFILYAVVDKELDFDDIYKDVVKRIFITVGMLAFALLIPLAVTSTDGWVRRLGARTWQRLHKLVYAAALLGVVHFVWRVKADLLEPGTFGTLIGVMLLVRVLDAVRQWRSSRSV